MGIKGDEGEIGADSLYLRESAASADEMPFSKLAAPRLRDVRGSELPCRTGEAYRLRHSIVPEERFAQLGQQLPFDPGPAHDLVT